MVELLRGILYADELLLTDELVLGASTVLGLSVRGLRAEVVVVCVLIFDAR